MSRITKYKIGKSDIMQGRTAAPQIMHDFWKIAILG